jgi:hypothetical protein
MITLSNAIDELRRIAEEAESEGFFSMDDIIDLTDDLEKAFVKGAEIIIPRVNRSVVSRNLIGSMRMDRKRRKRKRSPKQKLLDDMANKKYQAYKKKSPRGKKTYIDIRSQVSRSREYKRKASKL